MATSPKARSRTGAGSRSSSSDVGEHRADAGAAGGLRHRADLVEVGDDAVAVDCPSEIVEPAKARNRGGDEVMSHVDHATELGR